MNAIRQPRDSGFTLIELLLVVFILAMLAASTSAIVDGAHEQARYDENVARHDQIRRAIVGESDPRLPMTSFVADVGQSPRSISDLLVPPAWVGTYTPSRKNSDSDLITVGSGWRGPYLNAQRLPNGKRVFADGWGNPDQLFEDPNFGWIFEDLGNEERRITSLGADGAPGPAPTSTFDFAVDDAREILRGDAFVDLKALTCDLTIRSNAAGTLTLALRVWFPRGVHADDGGGDLAFIDGAAQVRSVIAGENPVQLSFETEAEPLLETEQWVPQGIRAVELRTYPGSKPTQRLKGEFALVELRPGARLVRLNRTFSP